MLYSCFDAKRGLYRVFQDSTTHAINGDHELPSLGPKEKLGVAAIDAGRRLPMGAKPIGMSWHARGKVVKCPGGPLGGLGTLLETTQGKYAVMAVALVVGALALWPKPKGSWYARR